MKTPNASMSVTMLYAAERGLSVAIEDLKNDMALHESGTIDQLRVLKKDLQVIIAKLEAQQYTIKKAIE